MLSNAQIKSYKEDGVNVLRDVFSEEWLELVHKSINFGRSNPGPMYLDYSKDTKPGSYCADMWIWRENEYMKEFMFNSPAAKIAGEAMQVDSISLITDNWLVREAGAVNRAPWHQDNPYFDVSGKWCILWMGLEPVSKGGGVVFLKGSHKWDRKFMPLSFTGSGQKAETKKGYEPTPDFSAELEKYEVLEFELAPGDCLIFDSHTVHGAPNPVPPSETVNRLTMRFAKGDALFEKRGSWTDEQTDYWEAHGMREGKPLVKGSLLPIVWQRKETP